MEPESRLIDTLKIITYFSGMLKVGKSFRKMFITSELGTTCPIKLYLPLAEATSNA